MKQLRLGLALLSSVGFAADPPKIDPSVSATTTEMQVVVDPAVHSWSCNESTAERARSLADLAFRNGAYQRAGECYLAAGEQAMADGAFLKAAAAKSSETGRTLEANRDALKSQVRQWHDALRRR